MKYNKLDLGTIEALVNKLGGMKGVKDFLSGKTKIVEAFEQIIFPVWKKINVGTYKDLKELYTALTTFPAQITNNFAGYVKYGMDKIVIDVNPALSHIKEERKLVNVSCNDLGIKVGFWSSITLGDIINVAKKNGLEFCSEEIAFQLPLQFTGGNKDRIHIITKTGKTFNLSWYEKEAFFSYYDYSLSTIFQKKDRFIFCLPG